MHTKINYSSFHTHLVVYCNPNPNLSPPPCHAGLLAPHTGSCSAVRSSWPEWWSCSSPECHCFLLSCLSSACLSLMSVGPLSLWGLAVETEPHYCWHWIWSKKIFSVRLHFKMYLYHERPCHHMVQQSSAYQFPAWTPLKDLAFTVCYLTVTVTHNVILSIKPSVTRSSFFYYTTCASKRDTHFFCRTKGDVFLDYHSAVFIKIT